MLTENVNMKLVPPDTDPEDMVKGDVFIMTRSQSEGKCPAGSSTIVSACPQCGFVAYHAPHIYDHNTRSVTPSLRCLQCDFHGHLTNGVFING